MTYGYERRYADAFLVYTGELDILRSSYESASLFLEILAADDVAYFMISPAVSESVKLSFLRDLIHKTKLPTCFLALIYILSIHRRLTRLDHVLMVYQECVDKVLGDIHVYVTSALALNHHQEQLLTQHLQGYLNKNLRMHYKIDESLIGGFLIYINNRLFDGSFAYEMTLLERALR